MTGLDLSAYTGVVDDLVSAVSGTIPTLVTAIAIPVGGLMAIRIGVRLVKSLVK